MNNIQQIIQNSIEIKQAVLQDNKLIEEIQSITESIVNALRNDHKIWFCGNGGSAADAQHLAAELSGRFYHDREPLFAEAFHVNTSYLTAVANDYSYEQIYSRLVKAKGRKGDVLIGISTSGNSGNIVKALEESRSRGLINVGLTGESGGKMKALCDHLINIPSTDTPRIQEAHILVGHIICELVEKELF